MIYMSFLIGKCEHYLIHDMFIIVCVYICTATWQNITTYMRVRPKFKLENALKTYMGYKF